MLVATPAGPVLVTGASGLLGREIVKTFKLAGRDVVGTSLTRADQPSTQKLDILDNSAIERVLDDVNPSVIINCAANRSPYTCQKDLNAARALNAAAAASLARSTARRGILMIQISTDYVFSGEPGAAPYRPSSTPNPINAYGQTKLEGEQEVLQETASAPHLGVVLRVPLLYGHTTRTNPEYLKTDKSSSSVHMLLASIWEAQAKKGGDEKIALDNHAVRYPTATEDVARVLVDLVDVYRKPHDETLPRVLHCSAEESMTQYRMAEVLAGILGLSLDGMEATGPKSSEAGDGVERPYDAHLESSDLKRLGIEPPSIGFEAWWRRELGAFRG